MSKTKRKSMTRREFFANTAGLVATGAASAALWPRQASAVEEGATEGKRSTVILVRDEEAVGADGAVNADALKRMLDRGVAALTGKDDPKAAWGSLFQASDTVGIKTNGWRFLRTPPELEAAIQARLEEVGIPEENIAVDDRGVLRNPVFQKATALVNVRPLRTHHWAGVGSLIKNYIMFTPQPSAYHDDSCANLAAVWDLPPAKGKTRLNILVVLTPLFHGKGPHSFQAEYTWPYRGLLIGTDPVAVDATGVRLLEAKRREHFGEDQPFATSPKHVQVAEEKFGLGVADARRIDVKKIGWQEGVLI